MLLVGDALHENVHLGLTSKRSHECMRRISALLQGFTLTATWLCVQLWFTFCTPSPAAYVCSCFAQDVKPFDGMDRANILKMMRRGSLQKLTWPTESSDAWLILNRAYACMPGYCGLMQIGAE